jgi:hypothetical protein
VATSRLLEFAATRRRWATLERIITRMSRDDFTEDVKRRLALRAGYKCSAPDCGVACVGPSNESESAYSNIGRAAHIAAAAPGGPRFDSSMDSSARGSIANGIWLCATHAALIDTDVTTYTVDVLQSWKKDHEERAARDVNRVSSLVDAREAAYQNWVERIRRQLKNAEHESMAGKTEGRIDPVARLLAPGERFWAARAVQEGHLDWEFQAGAVVMPGVKFTFNPAPDEALQFAILNPGSFGDELKANEFRVRFLFDFRGVEGQTALEIGPVRGVAQFWRIGVPAVAPFPVAVGVGAANGASPLGFLHDPVFGEVTINDKLYRYSGASNPLTSNTSAYVVFGNQVVHWDYVFGFAPAPIGPPASWKSISVRRQ